MLDNDDQLLFVYGSLMNPAERVQLLGRPIDSSPGRLPGYVRGRKRHYFVARQAGAVTDGAILEGLGARDLAILDEYEEVPTLYTRERIEVTAADGRKIECWIYLPASIAKS
ncbi:MAG TPA: gamma-glutamylcyclotransferase family protein [Candidatus Binataceae bacterium]|nr:gamma-glutamylcyclotransferase family protein [Candidatus Binataceae bacterium]